ncbi:protein ripply2 [Danio rerio]|uniref:protein ripply2 n=1 Tax=Danio rerio TaxID=7955 RepID=UPI000066372A|nr:protein ripply2 [Danio rerio]BAE53717.1 Ripply2 [Danio rerio]|eukprot:NP_001034198.1 protein ripply2 [Danio rerio]
MENITFTSGLNSEMDANQPWRPWLSQTSRKAPDYKPYKRPVDDEQHKLSIFKHPVKLFWPKSQCFDYLYEDAEVLLRNYPVQATICLYEDPDTEDEEDYSDEEDEKELR